MDLMKIAYDFEFEAENQVSPQMSQKLKETVAEWRSRHESEQVPFLFFTKSLDFVTVYDGRSVNESTKTRFEGIPAWILSYCNEKPMSLEKIQAHVKEKSAPDNVEEEAVAQALHDLEDKKIIYHERGKYLTLPLPHNSHL